MLGFALDDLFAVGRNRRLKSSLSEKLAGKTLIATIRSVSVSYARHTSPVPPRPNSSIRRVASERRPVYGHTIGSEQLGRRFADC
jgi:hypothetical protein